MKKNMFYLAILFIIILFVLDYTTNKSIVQASRFTFATTIVGGGMLMLSSGKDNEYVKSKPELFQSDTTDNINVQNKKVESTVYIHSSLETDQLGGATLVPFIYNEDTIVYDIVYGNNSVGMMYLERGNDKCQC